MDTTPRFSRTAAPDRRGRRWEWVAVAVLLALFAVQASVAARATLAADARWRPWVSALCGTLGCSIPAWREPTAFAMLHRDVHPLAEAPGLLRVQATFRNQARWPQAWPVLWLRLSDAEGRVTGEQGFAPHEYLPAERVDGALAPGQSAEVAFLVREPAAGTAAFSFDFR